MSQTFRDAQHSFNSKSVQDKGCLFRYYLLFRATFGFFIKYFLFLPLGMVTFGIFWSQDIREYVFSNHSEVSSDEADGTPAAPDTVSSSSSKRESVTSSDRNNVMISKLQHDMDLIMATNTNLVQVHEQQSLDVNSIRDQNETLVRLNREQSEQISSLRQENKVLVRLHEEQSKQMKDLNETLKRAISMLETRQDWAKKNSHAQMAR